MTIRIWHQSFTVLSDLGAYDDALRAHFKHVARPDTEVVMHGMRPGTYRSNYPGNDIRHAALQHLHATQFIEAGLAAEREGFDAYAISSLPDPALREIRSLLRIPVVGYGESAMLSSCLLGARFAVMVFISELTDLIADNAVKYGLGGRFAGVTDVGFRFNDVLEGFSSPGPLIDRFREAARKRIAEGAEVLIPGEAPLCVLLASQKISSVDGVPVLDSLSCWVKHAEMLVDLKRQSGVERCQRGYWNEPPARERVDELMAFYGRGSAA
ncbi:MAG: aspartate/glutamate racemase family protein [Gammaproteobacteria bacterium]|nr:aspartate/glutamate racemase family protein [Gammaproteobacteria bacterium]MBU1440213.1 aspartate/glutamate racemase family protein [Gammaproteobacteria bacterium]MBU2285988.1 aspartate/glutamate racemase family protein [Gammaproteobacteria bacterium]MBU2411030.1 aspartate/glutamate racemase family protein [Gammaproteobacteria bacterium]